MHVCHLFSWWVRTTLVVPKYAELGIWRGWTARRSEERGNALHALRSRAIVVQREMELRR